MATDIGAYSFTHLAPLSSHHTKITQELKIGWDCRRKYTFGLFGRGGQAFNCVRTCTVTIIMTVGLTTDISVRNQTDFRKSKKLEMKHRFVAVSWS